MNLLYCNLVSGYTSPESHCKVKLWRFQTSRFAANIGQHIV